VLVFFSALLGRGAGLVWGLLYFTHSLLLPHSLIAASLTHSLTHSLPHSLQYECAAARGVGAASAGALVPGPARATQPLRPLQLPRRGE
jgi:hypothetical protein